MHPTVPSRHPGATDGVLAPAAPQEWADPAGLSALFVRRHAELVRLALLLVGDQPTAEDVVNAWQGKRWGGYSNASYGTCLPNQIVSTTVGRGTWGPGYHGPHW